MNLDMIFHGHVLDGLKKLPRNSIDMVITSPPYWGLRNYNTNPVIWDNHNGCEHEWEQFTRKGISGGTKSEKVQIKDQNNFQIVKDANQGFCSKCNAWSGELGSEPTFQLYIIHLLEIFEDVRRVLKPTGSCWVNLGDSYSGSCRGAGSDNTQSKEFKSLLTKTGLKNKSLVGIPDRFKIAMIDNGWICRNEIIWHKPNIMPSSIKDRFTVDFEKLFFFTKEGKYYFEQQFEPAKAESAKRYDYAFGGKKMEYLKSTINPTEIVGSREFHTNRNMRTVWRVNTLPLKDAHFATFPPKLIEVPIAACCPPGGVVLDIFMGSGTVGLVAKQQGKHFLGIELNLEYIKIAKKRIGEIK